MSQNTSHSVMSQRIEAKRARDRAYYLRHKEKIKAQARERWKADPNARAKDKIARNKRREAIRVYDRMRSKRDKAKKTIVLKRWLAENPERAKALAVARSSARRARIRNAIGTWSASDVDRMLVAQKGRCWWCSKRIGKDRHVDHRFPISKNGTNDPSNLVLSCPQCNRAKSAKMPWKFAGRLL